MTTQSAPPATYVFAVCRRADEAVLAGLSGISGAPVRVLPFERLHAVVQDVPADGAGGGSWTERLSDPAELERCARAHHEVVTAAAARGPVVPLALATLYDGEERARRSLTADAARFHAGLDRVDGRDEWGVKVYAPLTRAAAPAAAAPLAPASGAPGAGRAYLERVRGAHRAREEGRQAALRAAEEADAVLRGLAVAARRLRPHTERLTEERGTQLLNAAYLVDRADAGRFAAEVAALRRRIGADLELSGPWVPYSFAGPDAASAATASGTGELP